MNKLLFTLLFAFIALNLTAQSCEVIKYDAFYIEIDIRSNKKHSITMSGLTNKLDFQNINKYSAEQFISDFYKMSNYVPHGSIYKNVLNECPNLQVNDNFGQLLMNQIYNCSREKTIILKDGANVFIRISKINADFILKDKADLNWPSVSNEYRIMDISEVDSIFIPIQLYSLKKPTRKKINKIFKKE